MENRSLRSLLAVVKRTINETAQMSPPGPSGAQSSDCPYCRYKSWPSLEFALRRHLARKHCEGARATNLRTRNSWIGGLFACHTFIMGPYLCQSCMFRCYLKLSLLEHMWMGHHVTVPGMKRWQFRFQLDCCDEHKLAQRQSTVPIRSLLVYLGAYHSCGGKARKHSSRPKRRESRAKTGLYASLMQTLQQRIGEQCQELMVAPGPQNRLLYKCEHCFLSTRSINLLKAHLAAYHRPQTSSDLDSQRQNGNVRSEVHDCPSCSFKTESRTYLANHVLVHHETPPTVSVTWFKCHKCCFKSKHRNLYRRHYFIMHE